MPSSAYAIPGGRSVTHACSRTAWIDYTHAHYTTRCGYSWFYPFGSHDTTYRAALCPCNYTLLPDITVGIQLIVDQLDTGYRLYTDMGPCLPLTPLAFWIIDYRGLITAQRMIWFVTTAPVPVLPG